MGYLTWWNFPKKAWIIIIGELCVIAALLTSLYTTYLNDVYFQSYANGLAPLLVPTLSVAFGISSASIAAYLYLGIRKLQIERGSEPTLQKRDRLPKPSSDAAHNTDTRGKNENPSQSARAKLRPIVPDHGPARAKSPLKEKESRTSIPNAEKHP